MGHSARSFHCRANRLHVKQALGTHVASPSINISMPADHYWNKRKCWWSWADRQQTAALPQTSGDVHQVI